MSSINDGEKLDGVWDKWYTHSTVHPVSHTTRFLTRDMGSLLHKQKCLRGGPDNSHERQRGKSMQNIASFTFKGKQHFLLDIFSVINLRQTGTCLVVCSQPVWIQAFVSKDCLSLWQWQQESYLLNQLGNLEKQSFLELDPQRIFEHGQHI